MPYTTFNLGIMLFLIIFLTQRNERNIIRKIIKKRKKGNSEMVELARNFIGKECIVYTFNSQITGIIKEVGSGGLLIEKSGTLEAVNFDYIVRIREYPKNKNGKKKSVVLD